MQLTMKEKLEIAKQLRNTNVIEAITLPEHEKNIELVICEEKKIATREGDCHIYIYTPKEVKPVYPLYINIHGGGFVRGYLRKHAILCSTLAARVGCKVIDIDYKLAPEYPYPVALNECYDLVRWIFSHNQDLNIDQKKIAVGGHSAGGNLTAAINIWANQSKEFKVQLQMLDYPYLDAATDPAEKVTETRAFPIDRARAFNSLYLKNKNEKFNPLVSPVCATKEMLTGLPPTLIITAERDFLCAEGEKYALMLVEAGVTVKLKRFLKSRHGFTENSQEEFEEAQNLIVDTLMQTFYN